MARKGKRERVIEARQSIITANQEAVAASKAEPAPKSKGVGPAGYRSASSDHKRSLKGLNSGVGFNGPRGFGTPVYAVHKAENTPGAIGPYKGPDPSKPAYGNNSKRFALDDHPGDAKPSDTVMTRRGKNRWRKL